MKIKLILATSALLIVSACSQEGPVPLTSETIPQQENIEPIETEQEEVESPSTTTEDVVEEVKLFDGRSWQLDYIDQQDDLIKQEYLLEGESVENWNELVTLQHFHHFTHMSVQRFVDDFQETLIESVRIGQTDWTIHHETDELIIYEFKVKDDPIVEDQAEIGVFFKTDYGIGFANLVNRKGEFTENKRKEWIKLYKEPEAFLIQLTDF